MVTNANKVPRLSSLLIIGDDPFLVAQLSSVLAKKGYYTPVVNAPRLTTMMDADNEVIRRNNAAARYKPKSIILAGATEEVKKSFQGHWLDKIVDYVDSVEDLKTTKAAPAKWPEDKLVWGRGNVGIGLLQALRKKQEIIFSEDVSDSIIVNPELEHIVVCEEGDELAQVIAANYAFSIGAGLCLIPKIEQEKAAAINESFYSSSEPGDRSQTECLQGLKETLRDLSSSIPLRKTKLLTFVTQKTPWGFAYPEVPTAHIFSFPDMGIAIINAIASEQSDTRGLAMGLIIDPEQIEPSEFGPVKENLVQRGMVLKLLKGQDANVYDVSRHITLLPYDFLLISTHCGDASGWEWTYEYTDSEGIERTLVVHIAIGVGAIPHEDEMFDVMQYYTFVSLDGVDWNDPKAKENLYVGTAIKDFIERSKDDDFEPVKKKCISRVSNSSVLKMWDDNLILVHENMAGDAMPIVLNNACSSWHRLASTFIYANARAYIGTLFGVLSSQAYEIAINLTDKYFGKSLAVALWRAQNDVYGNSINRPYILVGPHFQKFHIAKGDKVKIIFDRLQKNHASALYHLKFVKTEYDEKKTKEHIIFLKEQMKSVYKLIPKHYNK